MKHFLTVFWCITISMVFILCQSALTQTEKQNPSMQQNDLSAIHKAAEQGDADAQSKLGGIYYLGAGVPQDYAEAFFWYDLAASGKIGDLRRDLIDELRDDAAKHLTPAALEQGHKRAQKWFEAHGTSSSDSQTLSTSSGGDERTDSSGSFAAQYLTQKLTGPSKPTVDQESPPQNAEGGSSTNSSGLLEKPSQQRDFISNTRKAAEQGDAGAQYVIGLDYRLGVGVPRDITQAAVWYRKAAEQGNAGAQFDLGSMYESGIGVPRDITQATAWYRKAAEQGSESAQLRLGGMYMTGQGVPQSYAQAIIWYRNAAEQGNASAQQSLKQIAQLTATTSQSKAEQSTMGCATNISFGIATGGQILRVAPSFTQKWIEKNQKKHPGLCFSQQPNSQAANYLMVFSTSQSALNGFEPSLQTTTTTSTTPVYGSGIFTSNYGGTWNYTYSGMATTYATSTAQVNLPYTLTTSSVYENTYNQSGTLISQRWRSFTTQRGGDGYSALGTNIGALIRRAHIKERLLKDAVRDISISQGNL